MHTPSFSFSIRTFFSATSFFVFLQRALNTSLPTATIHIQSVLHSHRLPQSKTKLENTNNLYCEFEFFSGGRPIQYIYKKLGTN